MKLDLKNLSVYLPYEVYFINNSNDLKLKITGLNEELVMANGHGLFYFKNIKLILRPLSDIENEKYDFIYNKETDYWSIEDWISLDVESRFSCKFSYEFWELLYKHHFDVFDLIQRGLAIDINTL